MKETGARIVARTPTLAMYFSTSYLLSIQVIAGVLEQPGKSRSHVDAVAVLAPVIVKPLHGVPLY
jgi:hypothetical protein